MSTDVQNTFNWLDYFIFILTLVISAAIGIFYACLDRRKSRQTTANFLLGGRQMSLFPVTLSLMASFLSAVMVLGVPTEVFYNGTMYWLITFSNFMTFPVAAHAFIPVFHELGLTSAYEYLEKRFNKAVRIAGSVVFQLQMVLYMAVVLYAPAIALNQVMGVSIYVSILAIGLVCTFYTAIGGLKAVMWTDAFQMLIVFAGILAVVIKGMVEVGGFDAVMEIARNGSRLQANNFNANPLERHTFWTLVIGGFMTSMTIYGSNQAMIQRYLSMSTTKRAQITLYLQLPGSVVFTALLVFLGLVLYGKYHDNDPLQNCFVEKRDQLVPWLVMDILGQYHGFPGLLVACLFSASLSTVSSGVNALALVFLTDIIRPAYKKITNTALNEIRATVVSKVLALVFGLITVGLAFLAQLFGSLILQVALSIFGMVGGPLLGLFVCALFFPIINSWGALIGVVCSLGISLWVAIGSILHRHQPPNSCANVASRLLNTTLGTELLTSTQSMDTVSMDTVTTDVFVHEESTASGLDQLYSLSYLWYSTLAVTVTVVVGLVVSCFTGGNKKNPVDRRLLSPLYLKLCQLGPLVNGVQPLDTYHQANGNVVHMKSETVEAEFQDTEVIVENSEKL